MTKQITNLGKAALSFRKMLKSHSGAYFYRLFGENPVKFDPKVPLSDKEQKKFDDFVERWSRKVWHKARFG